MNNDHYDRRQRAAIKRERPGKISKLMRANLAVYFFWPIIPTAVCLIVLGYVVPGLIWIAIALVGILISANGRGIIQWVSETIQPPKDRLKFALKAIVLVFLLAVMALAILPHL